MLVLPTKELGIKNNSSYYFMPPDKKTAENLFYVFLTGHYFLDSKYYFSHNVLEELHYPNGITLQADGRFYSKKYDFAFDSAYLAIYVASGNMMYLGKEVCTAGSGQVLLIDKYKGHSYCSLGDAEKFYLHFDGGSSKMIVDELLKHGNLFHTESMRDVENIFHEIQLEAESGIEVDPIEQSARVHNLLALLHKSLKQKNIPKTRISDCADYINTHYKSDLNLEKLCKIACLSHSQLSVLFKKELNVTPYEYLLQVRFTVAKNCLSTTNMSISEIAYEVGFNSDIHFMALFKKRFGMTPSAFRKAHKNELFV